MGFKRSGLFGLIGVFVVAGILIAISTGGEGESNPKTTYALVFGVLAVFLVVFFALRRSDLAASRAARRVPTARSESTSPQPNSRSGPATGG